MLPRLIAASFAVGVALTTLGACDDGNAGSPLQGDAAVDDFFNRVATLYCERVGACCADNSQAPLETCRTQLREGLEGLRKRGGTFDQGAADACLASYEGYDCEAARDYVACSDIFRTPEFRTKKMYESCTVPSDCVLPEKGGTTCGTSESATPACGTFYSVPEAGKLRDSTIAHPACR